jgi:hypothetical protein
MCPFLTLSSDSAQASFFFFLNTKQGYFYFYEMYIIHLLSWTDIIVSPGIEPGYIVFPSQK